MRKPLTAPGSQQPREPNWLYLQHLNPHPNPRVRAGGGGVGVLIETDQRRNKFENPVVGIRKGLVTERTGLMSRQVHG